MNLHKSFFSWTTAFAVLISITAVCQAQSGCIDNSRIVGGVDTDIKKHPWQVAFVKPNSDLWCGGSIIADRWVLTAAHCIKQSAEVDVSEMEKWLKTKAGVTEFRQNVVVVEIEKAFVHKGFNFDTYENDLALVRLRNNPTGMIISLAEPTIDLKPCQMLEVTGWGRMAEDGRTSDKLQKAEVPYVDSSVCNGVDSYNGRIKPGMMCAGYKEGKIDACYGDSGGPLVLNGKDGSVLVGVVSGGAGCAKQYKYGVYTRVSAYRDWINKTYQENMK